MESPYQNPDDPITRSQSLLWSPLHDQETPPVILPPASKNTVNLLPDSRQTQFRKQPSILFNALDALGKTAIPGIGPVTAALLNVVKSVQVRAGPFCSFVLA